MGDINSRLTRLEVKIESQVFFANAIFWVDYMHTSIVGILSRQEDQDTFTHLGLF